MTRISIAVTLLFASTASTAMAEQGVMSPRIALSPDQQAQLQARATVSAATQATLVRGAAILDPGNAPLGRIVAVDDAFVTIATTKSIVRLPVNAFSSVGNSPTLGVTAAQIDLLAVAGSSLAKSQETSTDPQ